MKTLLVGIDGACLSILGNLIDRQAIPTIGDIIDRGSSADLESQLPPWTPSAWPSLYTGVNPGKHGVFDFLKFNGYDWSVVNRSDVQEYAIWELLSEKGIRSIVVNVPVTHPVEPFDGALIPGYTAPEDPLCHPPNLLGEVREAIGEYRIYGPQLSDGISKEERVDGYLRKIQMRGEAFRYLSDRYDPEFGFVQFQQTDTVFHEFPTDHRVIERVFEAVDEQIEQILEACSPQSIILVSDHGIGPYHGYEFRVNDFLRNAGFVETVAGRGGMPSWSTISKNRLRSGNEGMMPDSSFVERFLKFAAGFGITSQRAGEILKQIHLDNVVLKYVPSEIVRAGSERVDFASSIAYMRSRTELGIRINLAGREPNGIVVQENYETVRNELISLLENVTTPDGIPVFDEVLPRESVFTGPHVDDAPDIVLVPNNFDQYLSATILGEEFSPLVDRWNHKLNGFVAIDAPGFDSDIDRENPHLLDIAPTVLATLGVHMSDRMDGAPLGTVENETVAEYPDFTRRTTASTGSSRTVEKRLADLGYIE